MKLLTPSYVDGLLLTHKSVLLKKGVESGQATLHVLVSNHSKAEIFPRAEGQISFLQIRIVFQGL